MTTASIAAILSGLASVIGAITGLVVVFQHKKTRALVLNTSTIKPPVTTPPTITGKGIGPLRGTTF